MRETRILNPEIGRVVKFNTQNTSFPSIAETGVHMVSQHTIFMHVKYRDNTEVQSKTTLFRKRIPTKLPFAATTTSVDHYMSNWQLLKDAGFSVPPTQKVKENELLILDVSAGGLFFDIYMAEKLYAIKNGDIVPDRNFLSHPSIGHFLRTPISTIRIDAGRLAEMATVNNFVLPQDDPMNLLILPDGQKRYDVLDPLYLKRYDSQRKTYFPSLWSDIPHSPSALNGKNVDKFMLIMGFIKEILPTVINK